MFLYEAIFVRSFLRYFLYFYTNFLFILIVYLSYLESKLNTCFHIVIIYYFIIYLIFMCIVRMS